MWRRAADRRFRGYRFPAIIIGDVLRLPFNLSLLDIPEMMAARGFTVSHEIVWEWFRSPYTSRSVDAVQPGHKRHLDVMAVMTRRPALPVAGHHRRRTHAKPLPGQVVDQRNPAAAADRIDTGQVGRGR